MFPRSYNGTRTERGTRNLRVGEFYRAMGPEGKRQLKHARTKKRRQVRSWEIPAI